MPKATYTIRFEEGLAFGWKHRVAFRSTMPRPCWRSAFARTLSRPRSRSGGFPLPTPSTTSGANRTGVLVSKIHDLGWGLDAALPVFPRTPWLPAGPRGRRVARSRWSRGSRIGSPVSSRLILQLLELFPQVSLPPRESPGVKKEDQPKGRESQKQVFVDHVTPQTVESPALAESRSIHAALWPAEGAG